LARIEWSFKEVRSRHLTLDNEQDVLARIEWSFKELRGCGFRVRSGLRGVRFKGDGGAQGGEGGEGDLVVIIRGLKVVVAEAVVCLHHQLFPPPVDTVQDMPPSPSSSATCSLCRLRFTPYALRFTV
jgi:hypothetical protein